MATREIGREIERAIDSSRRILELKDDWDEEGSPGYLQETWDKATRFIRESVSSFHTVAHGLPAPRILPGPDGTIDIHWKTAERELLINIPVEDEPAEYYGDGPRESVKGKLDLATSNEWILMWLTR